MSIDQTTEAVLSRLSKLRMVRDYLRGNGHHVRRLAELGDKEAKRFEFVYRTCYEHPTDEKLQTELIHIWEQFVIRDLTTTERVILQNRYGHKVPE